VALNWRGRRTIEAWAAGDREAQLLKVEGSALIMLESVSYLADGTPVEYYRLSTGGPVPSKSRAHPHAPGGGKEAGFLGRAGGPSAGNDLRADRPVPEAAGGHLQAISRKAGSANPPEEGPG
jgi:hypothetical protein